MEKEANYSVKISPEAERYYLDILEYFYEYHNQESTNCKSQALLDKAISLENNPHIGRKEDILEFLGY